MHFWNKTFKIEKLKKFARLVTISIPPTRRGARPCPGSGGTSWHHPSPPRTWGISCVYLCRKFCVEFRVVYALGIVNFTSSSQPSRPSPPPPSAWTPPPSSSRTPPWPGSSSPSPPARTHCTVYTTWQNGKRIYCKVVSEHDFFGRKSLFWPNPRFWNCNENSNFQNIWCARNDTSINKNPVLRTLYNRYFCHITIVKWSRINKKCIFFRLYCNAQNLPPPEGI